MTLKDALARLKALGNERMRAQNRKHGADENQFGVRLGDIRKVAAPCYASFICLMAFSGTLGAQGTNLNRFRDPEGITADPTGLRRDTSVRAFPRYPRDLQEKAITGSLVAAFVIDTTGRVELETTSFVRTSRPEFVRAVCDLLPKLRFQPFLVGDQKWRVLLVESFAFNNWPEPDAAASALAAQSQEDFSTKPIAKVVEQLASLPHCDSPNIQ